MAQEWTGSYFAAFAVAAAVGFVSAVLAGVLRRMPAAAPA